jgi:hypothetical protein
MVRVNDCYVDTSAFIAFLDESDKYHRLFRSLFDGQSPLITSALTVAGGMVGSFEGMAQGGPPASWCSYARFRG